VRSFTIGGISFVPELWSPETNLKTLLPLIEETASKGAELIATPEGILDGYPPRELGKHRIRDTDRESKGFGERLAEFRERLIPVARWIVDQGVPALQAAARKHGVYLFANTLDLRNGDAICNTTYVVDPGGAIIATFDKVHAAGEVIYSLGNHSTLVETPFAPIGVLICADRQYPEAARALVLAGARVLVVNSYGMWGEGINERIIRQRAYENGCYLFFCHVKETVLVSPEGRILASTAGWEPVLIRTLDPREAVGRGLFGNGEMARTYAVDDGAAAYGRRYREGVERRRASAEKTAK
jgi:predicted amidohydrolase